MVINAKAIAQSRSRIDTGEAVTGRVEQHSLVRSLVLHLLPGVLIVSLFIITAPIAMQAGFPPLIAMTTAGIGFGLAFQIGHLFFQGKRRNGKWSLEGIVLYRSPIPIWQYLVLVPLFVIAAFIIDGLTGPLGKYLLGQFSWLPAWFELRDPSELLPYSRTALVATFGLYLALNGVVAPVIEEMYFRGYLLPRLSRFGRWSPIVELLLFTLYHFWQPYYYVTQFFGLLPVVLGVWWKRSIKLGIVTHCALNLIGGLLTAALILGQK